MSLLNNLIQNLKMKANNVELKQLELNQFLMHYKKNIKIANKNLQIINDEVFKILGSEEISDYRAEILEGVYNDMPELRHKLVCLSGNYGFASVFADIDFLLQVLASHVLSSTIKDKETAKLKLINRLEFFYELAIFQTELSILQTENIIIDFDEKEGVFLVPDELENMKTIGFVCEYLSWLYQLTETLIKEDYNAFRTYFNDLSMSRLALKHVDIFGLGVDNFIINTEELGKEPEDLQ